VIYGCGGGGGSSSNSPASDTNSDTATTTSGVAVDPYLVGAVFCIDENLNKTCDAGEPESTASDENGVFTFSVAVEEGDKIIMKTAGTHNGVPYQLSNMSAEYSGGEMVVVSPLTTLAEKGLTAEQIVALLDPDGSLGLTADQIGEDPVAALESLQGDISEENLAAVRASIGAYMLLRMINNNTELAELTGEELLNSEDVQDIADEMMETITEAITVDKISTFQGMIPDSDEVPEIDIMDVVNTAVTVCDYVMELAEAEYESSGNIGQAMAAVQSFKNNDLSTYIENAAPAQYIKHLIDNNEISQNLLSQMFSEYEDFAACTHGLKLNDNGRPMCNPEGDDDSDSGDTASGNAGEIQAMVADSPVLEYDFGTDAVEDSSDVFSIYGRAAGDYSVGACYTNAVRNNASWYVPDVEFFRCALAKTAGEELLSGIESGVLYAKFLTDGMEHRAKLTYAENNVTMNMCYDDGTQMVEDTENVQISITKSGEGYSVQGTVIGDNNYNPAVEGSEVARGFRLYATADTTGDEEIYSFIMHFLNEQSDNCTGASGNSLTEDDDQCFLRYEGNIVNGTESGIDYSIYKGLFAEKGYNDDDGLYFAGTSFATAFAEGYGYTAYSTPVENGFSYTSTGEEGWIGTSMLVDAAANVLAQYFGDEISAPARTVNVPDIANPWDCTAEGDFVEIDLDTIEGLAECTQTGLNGSGDITTCSEGIDSQNFIDQMQEFICDETDPITNGASACP